MRKVVVIKRTVGLGLVAGMVYAVWRAYRARVPVAPRTEGTWEAAPFPFPPIPRPAPQSNAPASAATPHATDLGSSVEASSVEPTDGECPASHPVKGKLASGIFHEPGGRNYTRTRADRCYVDGAAAEADGLRASKI